MLHVQPGEFHRMMIEGPVSSWKESRLHNVEKTPNAQIHTYKTPDDTQSS